MKLSRLYNHLIQAKFSASLRGILIFMLLEVCMSLYGHAQYSNTCGDEYEPYEEEDGWGFKNKEGKVIIQPKYERAWYFNDGFATVQKDDKLGFIDCNGKIVIPIKYDYAKRYSEGLISVDLDGKMGVIDINENIIIPFKYYDIFPFKDGKAGFQRFEGGPWGFLNKSGDIIVADKYDEVSSFHMNRALVKLNERYGVIDESGKEVIPVQYSRAYRNTNFEVFWNTGWGVFEKQGYSKLHDMAWTFDCVIDTAGNVLLEPIYSSLHIVSAEVFLAVTEEGEMNFIDIKGNTLIKNKFDYIPRKSQGMLVVSENGVVIVENNDLKGVVNKKGQEIIVPEFDRIWTGEEELGIVGCKKDEKWYLFDHEGNLLTSIGYDDIRFRGDFVFAHVEGGDGHFFSDRGKVFKNLGTADGAWNDEEFGAIVVSSSVDDTYYTIDLQGNRCQ